MHTTRIGIDAQQCVPNSRALTVHTYVYVHILALVVCSTTVIVVVVVVLVVGGVVATLVVSMHTTMHTIYY